MRSSTAAWANTEPAARAAGHHGAVLDGGDRPASARVDPPDVEPSRAEAPGAAAARAEALRVEPSRVTEAAAPATPGIAAEPPYDPQPWRVLEGLQAIPLPPDVRSALRRSHESRCRRIAFVPIRAVAVALIALGLALRLVLPARWHSYRALHAVVIASLEAFALPETKWLILRHFDIGSRILGFLVANSGRPDMPHRPLHPRTLADLWPDGFMQHDLDLYRVLEGLARHDVAAAPDRPDFSAIVDIELRVESFGPRRWWQGLDLQSAVEFLVPLYVLFLPLRETFRASHSLQLDEVVGLHLAQLKGDASGLVFLRNHSPWLPLPLWGTGRRLLLHGLATEVAYEMLRRWKRECEAGDAKVAPDAPPRRSGA